MDAVRDARVCISEDAPVRQVFRVHDVVGVDGGGSGIVGGKLLGARVCDVRGLEVGRELEAVGLHEAVGDHLHDAGQGLEAIDHLWDGRGGAEVLKEAIRGVGEPDIAGGVVLSDVVYAGEVATEEGAEQWCGCV